MASTGLIATAAASVGGPVGLGVLVAMFSLTFVPESS